MILERMSDEEFERLSRLIEPQIPRVEARTGLSRKFIREVLIVSAYLLARERGRLPMSLDEYIRLTAPGRGVDTSEEMRTWQTFRAM